MNINELKAFMSEKPNHLGTHSSIQNQLRDAGLRQAIGSQGNEVTMLSSKLSSNTAIGARVFNNALKQNLTLDNQGAKLPTPGPESPTKPKESLFDFEEISRNVLKFVGGAIKHAQSKGVDDKALTSLFEQARAGVLKGVAMAKKDLAGLMSDEIKTGISRSEESIEQGLQKLQNEVFGKTDSGKPGQSEKIQISQQARYLRSDSGSLNVRTADGDEVQIRFENLSEFNINRQLMVEAKAPTIYDNPVERPGLDAVQPQNALTDEEPAVDQGPVPLEQQSQSNPGNPARASDQADNEQALGKSTTQVALTESYQHFESSSFSFSVQGELDEGEIAAIGKLVTDANNLADEFFNGDMESAFNQALEFGFDEKELTSFALQLTKVEHSQSIQAYESVSHFNEEDPRGDPLKVVKPISHYLDKMLDVIEQSRQNLESGEEYDSLINGLINQMGEVHTPDLISAIQRFHTFNQRLIDGLPLNLNKQSVKQ